MAALMSRPARSGGMLCISFDALSISVVAGQLAVIEIGRERDEAGGAQAIGHLLDSRIEPPPFLNDEYSGSRSARRRHEITGRACPLLGNSTVSAMAEE